MDLPEHSSQSHQAATARTSLPTQPIRAGGRKTMNIGRAPDNEVRLDSPDVSRHHARLDWDSQAQPVLTDLDSTNGTFVNGEPLDRPRLVSTHDLICIGGYLLRVEGAEVKWHDLSASRVTAYQITKDVPQRRLLNDISFSIYPREFVGLMGPTGCGKSTLMDALNGLRPATSGYVYIDDLDLYHNFDALRRSIGYVPQHDVLHEVLTVERTLCYAARLRLPEMAEAERQRVVDEVIEAVELTAQREMPFGKLSGGQQKRLSLALELLTKPSFLFLDEPTSPLDPVTTENMMLLFRRLADEGRIVVMVTHKFEKFETMHQVAILTTSGDLAFFGPPHEALRYFDCREPSDIYRRLSQRPAEEWAKAFQDSEPYRRYVDERIAETQELFETIGSSDALATSGAQGAGHRFGARQWLTLTQRCLALKLQDKRNTALLLLQAPLVALILALFVSDKINDVKTLFIAAIIAIWFGANNSIREIVVEAPIYTRERLATLKIPSYVLSKFTVLSGIALLQCFLLVFILVSFGRLSRNDFGWLTLILYGVTLGGVAMGLFCSALVNSAEKAMSILPLILIPQLLLSGFLVPLKDVYANLSWGMPATEEAHREAEGKWKLYREQVSRLRQTGPATDSTARKESLKTQSATVPRRQSDKRPTPGDIPCPPCPPHPADLTTSNTGLGSARFLANLMIARWAVEALAHQVSITNDFSKDQLPPRVQLPMRITVERYKQDGWKQDEGVMKAEYRAQIRLDLAALGGFIALFLALTMWALKRKDVL